GASRARNLLRDRESGSSTPRPARDQRPCRCTRARAPVHCSRRTARRAACTMGRQRWVLSATKLTKGAKAEALGLAGVGLWRMGLEDEGLWQPRSLAASTVIGRTLQALLSIDYPELEIIVVDDGSEDRTASIAAAFGPYGVQVIQ